MTSIKVSGLIPSQIGFSERVHPRGNMRIVWMEAIQQQVNRDEARTFSEPGALLADSTVDEPKRFSLSALLP